MLTHTKVICTIGPAVNSLEKILELIKAGMNVARINFSHGTHEDHYETIQLLKKAREQCNKPLAIMLDTKGPEVRIKQMRQEAIEVFPEKRLRLVPEIEREGDVAIFPFEALGLVQKKDRVLFDDGYIVAEVQDRSDREIFVEIKNFGLLKRGKKVNVPEVPLQLPPLTENDIADLRFGCKNDIDIIAASFVRSAEHVEMIHQLLVKEGASDILIISKIENVQGVENFDTILEASDGIMIARGDLGVEVELALVPKLQKMMIRKCNQEGKPVIIATQMLESMIEHPRPTRAEVSDVANAIYDSASAVMLSAETSTGKYPVEAVLQMKEIIKQAEEDFSYREFFREVLYREGKSKDISSSVATAAVTTSYATGAAAIFAFTSSGFTANLVSRLRPEIFIVALTTSKKTYYQMALIWGTIPAFVEKCSNADEAFSAMSQFSLKNHYVAFGDLVVVTSGVPFGKKGSTNMMMVENIGQILVRGTKGCGKVAEGKVLLVTHPEKISPLVGENRILVLPRCDGSFSLLMEKSLGVILQNHPEDNASEDFALSFAKEKELPLILRAERAMSILKEGENVVIDPKRGIVYRRVLGK